MIENTESVVTRLNCSEGNQVTRPYYWDFVEMQFGPQPLIYFQMGVREMGLAAGAKISEDEIARHCQRIHYDCLWTSMRQQRLAEQSAIPKSRLPKGLAVRGRGNKSRVVDFTAIAGVSGLLQRMKGHNARIGWANWYNYPERADTRRKPETTPRKSVGSGERRPSELQLLAEKYFRLVNPDRKIFPPPSYYPEVKRRLGLRMPR